MSGYLLKAIAGFDLLINCIGYGALTMFAGYAAVSERLEFSFIVTIIGFACLFASLYPVTQIYQYDEDKKKGIKHLQFLSAKIKPFIFHL